GDPWGSLQPVQPSGTTSTNYMSYSAAPVVFNNNLYLFFNGPAENGWLYYISSSDGNNWSEVINVSNTGLSYTPSPVVYDGQIYVFRTARRQAGQIWFNLTTGGSGSELTWRGDQEIPGFNNSSVVGSSYNGVCPPVAVVFNGELYLFYITGGW